MLYLKARYFEGVIFTEMGSLNNAVKAFVEVYQEANSIDERLRKNDAQMVSNLKELSIINIASIYYRAAKYKESSSFYEKVDRMSNYWPESIFRDAWSNFMSGDLAITLGKNG